MMTIQLPGGVYEYDPDQALGPAGGFGEVFEGIARDGCEVAVKRLHLGAAQAAHREMRIASELRDRSMGHVLPFIDSGEDAETGAYFVVMPRASGDLESAIQAGGTLAAAEAAAVLREIAEGLVEVGDLVHRDLKPANILRHEGRWKIADFGIARFAEEATSSHTLRECCSPHYAAPEQWRLERTTHATDVYALGCIAFFLIQGRPPFMREPDREHCETPAPPLGCADGRLESLVRMMLRKLPETRPTLSRVAALLADIVSSPSSSEPTDDVGLSSASAKVAADEERRQAQESKLQAAQVLRSRLCEAANEILRDNLERLWGKVHSLAPAAERHASSGSLLFDCSLGSSRLIVVQPHKSVPEGAFSQSQWDVISSAEVHVQQKMGAQYDWSASLWYARLAVTKEPRWLEVGYMWSPLAARGRKFEPCAYSDLREADLAASRTMGLVQIAFGPEPIDDESEAAFHERWMWLLAHAAKGELQRPRNLPIQTWPPLP